MTMKNPALSPEFTLYKLTDPDSAWGYEYVAANENRACCISFSPGHLCVDEGDSEPGMYLDTDYISTGEKISFPINDIRDIIVDCYSCEEFSLTAYREAGEIDKLTIVLGRFETYREHEFEFDGKEVVNRREFDSDGKAVADGRSDFLIVCASRIRDILTPLFDSVVLD